MELNTGIQKPEVEAGGAQKKQKVPVNSINFNTYVARKCDRVDNTKGIKTYDHDNLYPQKIKAIAERSTSVSSAINIAEVFLSGMGFMDEYLNDEVINRSGETFSDLHNFISREKKMFGGFAVHVSYNPFGEPVEYSGVPFEFVRISSDGEKYIVNPSWESNNMFFGKFMFDVKRESIKYRPFNPENVLTEIKQDGFDNYTGQLFYWKRERQSTYPLTYWDSAIDYAQFEAESGIYQLSSIQNDFSLSGVLKLPPNATFNQKKQQQVSALRNGGTGASNAGRLLTLNIQPVGGELKGYNVFEPFTRNNIDNLFENQNKNAEIKIFSTFSMPRILASITDTGMFNSQEMEDAYKYYNAMTERERSEITKAMTILTNGSIWEGRDFSIIKTSWEGKENGNVDIK